jgi:hypothetical protein
MKSFLFNFLNRVLKKYNLVIVDRKVITQAQYYCEEFSSWDDGHGIVLYSYDSDILKQLGKELKPYVN